MAGWHKTSRHQRGYGTAWLKLRQATLCRDNHLCQPCLKAGRVTPATEVDHITPKAKGGKDDLSNTQGICTDCHKAKTAADEGRKLPRAVGLDGYPLP